MEIPIKMDDLGGTTIFGNPHTNIHIIIVKPCRWLCFPNLTIWDVQRSSM